MKKKILSFTGYFCFLYVLFELVSLVAYSIFFREAFSFSKTASTQRKIFSIDSAEYSLASFGNKMVSIHPYQGYIYSKDQLFSTDGVPVSEYGFLDLQDPIQKKNENKVIVGVFGASVAWWFTHQGAAKLKLELSTLEKFKEKEIIVLNLAIGAYKQPQQLITLSYLHSIGAEFDYILNIDGFNEITLPIIENNFNNINPVFPMYWKDLSKSVIDIEQQRVVGSLVYLKKARAYTAELFSKLKFSISATTLWSIVDKIFQKKINSLTEIKSDKKELHSIRGPLHVKRSTEEELSEYANIWTRSSLAMSKLAQSSNAKYLHFLQPNQYVKDSKPIMGEERKFISAETYRNLVEVGYPILFKAGEFIKSQGVNYYDLTKTFKDINDPIYVDDCCHINKLGNDLLAVEVAKAIQAID